ncbi:MAG: PASTA domain-containing protein [Oscillospiraceae bacterium]|nr:PASTA domain-containing protein [Oscillospiraceae bacterium]
MAKGVTVRMRRRSLAVSVFVSIVCFVILAFRLADLQIIKGRLLGKMAEEQQLADTKLVARRGTIYDRNMIPIAQSATVWDVVLEPNYIRKDSEKLEIICAGLSEILGKDKEKIKELASKNSFYSILKKKVESDIKDRITDFKIKNDISNGIRLVENYRRYYPLGCFAAPVLGFTGADGQGLAGLEAYYEKTLAGEYGRLVSAKNAIGTDMPFDYEQMIPSKDGYSLRLCIDSSMQRIVEKHLEDAIKLNKVQNRAAAIAMDADSGEILAMAIKGDFDPNEPFKISNEDDAAYLEKLPENEKPKARAEMLSKQWRNKIVSDTYYPGSVFKMVTASAGLELGCVSEDSRFNCSGGIKISEKSQYIRCHKRIGHGSQTFFEAFCHSCNPAFISLGQKIGTENFFNYYKMFGFHEKTGIDLPGEARDLFFSADGKMTPIDLAVASMGQNFSITPIQMITAACAIANGGKLLKPHVVKEIIDKDGNIIKSFGTEVRRNVISENTARRVCSMMKQNTIIGGAVNAYIPGMNVAGKTGTSEKIGLSTPGYKDYISSFCGFGPVDSNSCEKKIAFLVFLDTPRGPYYYGSMIAAPIFSVVMREIMPLAGNEPRYTPEEMEKYGAKTPNFIGKKISIAKNEVVYSGFVPIISGRGETVVSQVPIAGEQIPKGGSIVLYAEETETENIKVPNFVGLSLKQLKETAKKEGLNLVISGSGEEGSGLAVAQSPEAGRIVPKGSVVNVVVRKNEISD